MNDCPYKWPDKSSKKKKKDIKFHRKGSWFIPRITPNGFSHWTRTDEKI